jgi:hypothetical protein
VAKRKQIDTYLLPGMYYVGLLGNNILEMTLTFDDLERKYLKARYLDGYSSSLMGNVFASVLLRLTLIVLCPRIFGQRTLMLGCDILRKNKTKGLTEL